MANKRILSLLSKDFPDIRSASMEIINLAAILSLPKGTEYFFSDLHGEHEAFIHMLRSASGVIREKIDWIFSKVTVKEREELAQLIYSPSTVIERKKQELDFDDWCRVVILQLIEVCKNTSSKYTRSKVRKRLPKGFAYIMDELLHADDEANKAHYYSSIISSLISTGMAESFIVELCSTISKLAVDRLHIIGDVFDRGPHPDYIMDYLVGYDNVDFQWGNHDINWIGAYLGNYACIANALRVSFAYNNFDMLEIGYGMNLRPLAVFAAEVYKNDECSCFTPKVYDRNKFDPVDFKLVAKMHKAISIIQFKVEGEIIKNHPEYNADKRVLLDKIDFNKGIVVRENKEYPLRDSFFPTVDPANPLKLTDDEREIMEGLAASFKSSIKLNTHIRFLLSHGGLYHVSNNNLLFHGCIPMTPDGEFEPVDVGGGRFLSGKAYFDYLDGEVRRLFRSENPNEDTSLLWYLWSGGKSPLFGKANITTFERFFIESAETHKEPTDPYYIFSREKATCLKILKEFGLDEDAHIINGHIPVKHKLGESPVKAEGKLFVIDGGMAKSYQNTTGIAGYTLIYNSRYIALAQHKQGELTEGISPSIQVVEYTKERITVENTDNGKELKGQIQELQELIDYYKEFR